MDIWSQRISESDQELKKIQRLLFEQKMVSRRKILSRSTDDLNLEAPGLNEPEEEDVWFNKDKLYKVGKDQQFRALDFLPFLSIF